MDSLFCQPQLCKTYTDKINVTGWFVEPKINGNRGIIIIKDKKITVLSRNNKPIYNTEHIQQAILRANINNVVLDGEFYVRHAALNEDWSITTSILRTQSKHQNSSDLNFWAFDMIPINCWRDEIYLTPLHIRKSKLLLTVNKIKSNSVIYVDHQIITEQSILSEHMTMAIEHGWEGLVIKNPMSYYRCKRSSDWLKLKPVHTEEYPIIRIQEGKGKYVNTTGAIVINVNGVEVSVGTGMTDIDRLEIWEDRHMIENVLLEVSYQTKSKDGSLIFPVFQRVRWDLL